MQEFSRKEMAWTHGMVFPSLKGTGQQVDCKGSGTQDSRKRVQLASWWGRRGCFLCLDVGSWLKKQKLLGHMLGVGRGRGVPLSLSLCLETVCAAFGFGSQETDCLGGREGAQLIT